jgi:hypothetical protein
MVRKYEKRDPDHPQKIYMAWYQKSPENKERMHKNSRCWYVKNRAYVILKQALLRTEKKGLPPCTLTEEWIQWQLDIGTCEISGIPFNTKDSKRTWDSPSLDRIDSTKGYSPENCRMILWCLNLAFSNWGEETFKRAVMAWLKTSP